MTGNKHSMPLYAAVEMYAAQMRVILPSILAPFGLPQPSVDVLNHTILVPPTGVTGWKAGENLSARAWRQAPGLVTGPGGNSTYCGHIVVANGAEQSSQSFTLRLGGSFPSNTTWWSMRVVRMFDADYAITVSPDGTFSVCHNKCLVKLWACEEEFHFYAALFCCNRITSTPARTTYIRSAIVATKSHRHPHPSARLILYPWVATT